jgi:hypothetical protein
MFSPASTYSFRERLMKRPHVLPTMASFSTVLSFFAVHFLASFIFSVGGDGNYQSTRMSRRCALGHPSYPETCVFALSSSNDSKDTDVRALGETMVKVTVPRLKNASNIAGAQKVNHMDLSDKDS